VISKVMKIKIALKVFFAAFVLVFCVSCVSHSSPGSKVVRYQGHYTLGAAKSTFTPEGSHKAFVVMADDMPDSVYAALKAQSQYADITSESDKSVSVFADVAGQVLPAEDGVCSFHATKVYSISPPKQAYMNSLAQWPPVAKVN